MTKQYTFVFSNYMLAPFNLKNQYQFIVYTGKQRTHTNIYPVLDTENEHESFLTTVQVDAIVVLVSGFNGGKRSS